MLPKIHLFCLSVVWSHFASWTRAELFTAVAQMEPLLETHKRVIDDLDEYIVKETRRLSSLKTHLEVFKAEHEKAMKDVPNYIENPLTAYTLIKRLTIDLDELEDNFKIGKDNAEYIKNVTMKCEGLKYPTLEDLKGAAQALTRLQTTYHLAVTDLAEGKLNGVRYSYPMTASDCFEFARSLYHMKDFIHSLPWSLETYRRYKEESTKKHSFTEVDILEYIAFTHYLLADVKTALEWTRKLLKLDPKHPRAAGNVPHYEKAIAEQEAADRNKRRGETGESEKEEVVLDMSDENIENAIEKTKYEALCRDELEISSDIIKRLFCRYMSETHPFLRLAPLKVEQLYIEPDVFMFHQVLSDAEIELVKEMSMPRFTRAGVVDPKTEKQINSDYRISKVAWLRDEESGSIARISQRAADMTGLAMDSAEELQVVNYGIGGHYEPHFDFVDRYEDHFTELQSDRIATVLFYMSEVAQGGATVFTELGLSVFPERGAALVWANLHPSGEGDTDTRHGACPVLRGSKWVCTKWIHEGGQEFKKPCNLVYQRQEVPRSILPAVPKSTRQGVAV